MIYLRESTNPSSIALSNNEGSRVFANRFTPAPIALHNALPRLAPLHPTASNQSDLYPNDPQNQGCPAADPAKSLVVSVASPPRIAYPLQRVVRHDSAHPRQLLPEKELSCFENIPRENLVAPKTVMGSNHFSVAPPGKCLNVRAIEESFNCSPAVPAPLPSRSWRVLGMFPNVPSIRCQRDSVPNPPCTCTLCECPQPTILAARYPRLPLPSPVIHGSQSHGGPLRKTSDTTLAPTWPRSGDFSG